MCFTVVVFHIGTTAYNFRFYLSYRIKEFIAGSIVFMISRFNLLGLFASRARSVFLQEIFVIPLEPFIH